MPPAQELEKDYGRTDSYRVATMPFAADDGLTSEGRPRSRRKRPPSKASMSSPMSTELEQLRSDLEMDEHCIPMELLFSRYSSDPQSGLSSVRVQEVYEVFGPNRVSPPLRTPEWVRFCKNLFGGFSLILWLAAALSFLTFSIHRDLMDKPPYDNLVIGVILVIIVVFTGLYSYYEEVKFVYVLESFQAMPPQFVSVIREGHRQQILTEELVMGDIVEMRSGDRVPADIRVITSSNLYVDQSALTGQLEPQQKSPECTSDNILESMNVLFCNSYIIEGSVRGIVITTSDRTIVGRIKYVVSNASPSESVITEEIAMCIHVLTMLGVFFGLLFLVISFIAGFHWLHAIVFLVGILVALVPEGLLATVTIILTIVSNRLYTKNCLIKNMAALELLGSVQAIIVDKKNALTQNRVAAAHMWVDGVINSVDLSVSQTNGADQYKGTGTFRALSRICTLCNSAQFKSEDSSSQYVDLDGNDVDNALFRFMEVANTNVADTRQRFRRVCEIPWNVNSRLHVTVHESSEDPDSLYTVYAKGAPERLLERSKSILIHGKDVALDDKMKEALSQAYLDLGNLAESVIGVCDLKLPKQKFPAGYPFDADLQNFSVSGLRFVGLVSFSDPPRSTVPDAVRRCKTAGIKVIMVTGDHPLTARSVARSVGIFSEGDVTVEDIAAYKNLPVDEVEPREANAAVIHGNELKDMTEDKLEEILKTYNEIIFARTTPVQKLILVETLQNMGAVVACTGQGVADVLAIKKADIGIGLGSVGSEACKEASDIIVLDDNFATVVSGIEEGRLVYDNIRKAVCYTMASNMPELWPFLMFLFGGLPLPMGAITILVIDLGTDFIPAVSFAYENPEYDVMKQKPRNRMVDRIIDFKLVDLMDGQVGMIQVMAGFFTYFVIMAENGFWLQDTFFTRRAWDCLSINDYKDSYNQEWTYEHRKYLEFTCHSGFFISIVVCQWATLIICKTRWISIKYQGMRNRALNFALGFETILAIILLYFPGMHRMFRLMPVKFNWWITALPYSLAIFGYDEIRRTILGHNPHWGERATPFW